MTILIVGGGWSGLAAAVSLSKQGHSVRLLEAAGQLGGRARSLPWDGITIDNGQHLMIGAYHQLLALLNTLNVDENKVFSRQTLHLPIVDTNAATLNLSARGFLPWPISAAWHLYRSAGLASVCALIRLQRSIDHIQTQADISVLQWLNQTKQPARLIRQLWQPLCLGTLNTPLDQASAHLFAAVIKHSLLQSKQAADLLIPQQPLAAILPDAASCFLAQKGVEISLQTTVSKLLIDDNTIHAVVTAKGETIAATQLIVATPVTTTLKLLGNSVTAPQPQHYPIATVYLQYAVNGVLPQKVVGSSGTLSQWLFDRSDLRPGLIAVVISGPGPHQAMSKATLIATVAAELHQLFPQFPEQAQRAYLIREKRATFASSVAINKLRPECKTSINGLWLAGDFVANQLPATLEGAVINGISCAEQIIAEDSI